jgi:hypothetical protein
MDRATNREPSLVIEVKSNLVADGLLARVEFHVGLININMMRDPIVVQDLNRRTRCDGQGVRSKFTAALTDRDRVRRETRDRHGDRNRHRDQGWFHTQIKRFPSDCPRLLSDHDRKDEAKKYEADYEGNAKHAAKEK